MQYESKTENGVLTVTLTGELDHHAAASARDGIDMIIDRERPRAVRLDLESVYFCDSSGLGLLMGRYKKARRLGATLSVLDPSAAVERIMRLAGLDKLIKTERSK